MGKRWLGDDGMTQRSKPLDTYAAKKYWTGQKHHEFPGFGSRKLKNFGVLSDFLPIYR